ncbi:MAG: hypothetical protein KBB83_01535 [Alphaproteobacteria bacterium]|nr:hypothetical protein [Alphaproteobacteria bacterium]
MKKLNILFFAYAAILITHSLPANASNSFEDEDTPRAKRTVESIDSDQENIPGTPVLGEAVATPQAPLKRRVFAHLERNDRLKVARQNRFEDRMDQAEHDDTE